MPLAGCQAESLRRKSFAVLKLLVEPSGQLVAKRQLLDAVWPGTFVSDAVLKDSIRQLREALNDDAESWAGSMGWRQAGARVRPIGWGQVTKPVIALNT
jgi:DNA-binding response OmpR family regulator